jgi:hypothetical protein
MSEALSGWSGRLCAVGPIVGAVREDLTEDLAA